MDLKLSNNMEQALNPNKKVGAKEKMVSGATKSSTVAGHILGFGAFAVLGYAGFSEFSDSLHILKYQWENNESFFQTVSEQPFGVKMFAQGYLALYCSAKLGTWAIIKDERTNKLINNVIDYTSPIGIAYRALKNALTAKNNTGENAKEGYLVANFTKGTDDVEYTFMYPHEFKKLKQNEEVTVIRGKELENADEKQLIISNFVRGRLQNYQDDGPAMLAINFTKKFKKMKKGDIIKFKEGFEKSLEMKKTDISVEILSQNKEKVAYFLNNVLKAEEARVDFLKNSLKSPEDLLRILSSVPEMDDFDFEQDGKVFKDLIQLEIMKETYENKDEKYLERLKEIGNNIEYGMIDNSSTMSM
jgi:hypothetical protein